jgi:SAM-dependent methyltransferase
VTRTVSKKELFTLVYEKNLWQGDESVSGSGSSLRETSYIRQVLPRLFDELNVSLVLDAPCGDFNWMGRTNLNGVTYLGADIVEPLIKKNQKTYATERIQFTCLDITEHALPQADLMLCRDCLAHLPTHLALKALRNILQSDITYLLATTYPDTVVNTDIGPDHWRMINLELPPFNLGAPQRLINEQVQHPIYPDKSLGLWMLSTVRNSQLYT